MKKFITTLCLILSLLFVISGCSCGGKSDWKVGYAGGEVSSNGGFAVVVGEYTYFINGIEDSTAKNSFGTPVKGSLVRVKTNELGQGANAESAEVVVPKLFASTHYGSSVSYQTGVTVFGDYVYYGTPSTEQDKKGNVKNDIIVFQRTSLDGTKTDKIAEFVGMSTEYKFVSSGNKVYLIVIETANNLHDINVYSESGSKVFEKDGVDSLVLPNEFEGDYLFFTDKVKDADEQDKAYGAIYSYKFGDSQEKFVINGADSRNDGSAEFGTQGRVFTVDAFVNDLLYFSYVSADTTDGTRNQYAFLPVTDSVKHQTALTEDATDTEKADFNTKNVANFNLCVALGSTQTVVEAIVPTAYYFSATEIVYYNAEYGIMSYDYTQAEVAPYYGSKVLLDKGRINIDSAKLINILDNYAYFTDSKNLIYRIELTDGSTMEQITTVAQNAWYTPEVVGDYLLVSLSGEPYNSYVYAFNLSLEADVKVMYAEDLADLEDGTSEYQEKLDELVEEYLSAITEKEENAIKSIVDKRVGPMKKADKNAVTSYMSATYASSSSSSK